MGHLIINLNKFLIMKNRKNKMEKWLKYLLIVTFISITSSLMAQEIAAKEKKVSKPVKNTFESIWLFDNQSVMVPIKKTFELDIMHRFGTVNKGYEDFIGLFAPSNIRIGASYVPIKNLNIGLGFTKFNNTWDASAKYAILHQTKDDKMPMSVTYYGNVTVDTRPIDNFNYSSERYSFFNQIIIARKINDKLSAQIAPSVSHQNSVQGYYSAPGKISKIMENDHIAIAFGARYKLKESMCLIVNYDQPITKHASNNPNPNLSLGIEMNTSAHAFQFFLGNYFYLSPQYNNISNHNNWEDRKFLIGFNITRLWNY